MMFLEEDVAVTVCLGPFINDTDGKTAVTNLTTAHDYVYLSINGGHLTLKTEETALATDILGYYHCLLDATDVGTKGILRVAVHLAGTLPVWQDYMVISHDAYQSLCGDHVIGAAAIAANNLDHLCLTPTAAVDMTSEVADGTILSRMLSATSDTSTYLAATESLEALRDRGDLAWATGAATSADLAYAPSGAPTITTKHADAVVGDYTKLAVVDGDYFSIREVATTNPPLDFYFPFAPAAGVFPATLKVWGYYSGNSTHWMRVQAAVGGVTTVWEDIGTIPNGSAITAYSFPLTPQHINASTGAAYIRFLHNGVAGIASHYLYLDKLLFTASSNVTSLATIDTVVDGIASDIAALGTKTDVATAVWADAAGVALLADVAALLHYRKGALVFEDDTPGAGYVTMKVYNEDTDALVFTHVITKATGNRAKAT